MPTTNPTFDGIPAIAHQRGMTLLEILIAVSILSVGLLGLAHLQLLGLESTDDSYRRSMVSYVANDLADRMRANRQAALNGSYDDWDSDDYFSSDRNSPSSIPTLPASVSGCQGSSCSPAQIAILDQREWLDNFVNVNGVSGWSPVVDSAHGEVQRDGTRVKIVLSWKNTETSWDTANSERTNVVRTPTFDLEFDL